MATSTNTHVHSHEIMEMRRIFVAEANNGVQIKQVNDNTIHLTFEEATNTMISCDDRINDVCMERISTNQIRAWMATINGIRYIDIDKRTLADERVDQSHLQASRRPISLKVVNVKKILVIDKWIVTLCTERLGFTITIYDKHDIITVANSIDKPTPLKVVFLPKPTKLPPYLDDHHTDSTSIDMYCIVPQGHDLEHEYSGGSKLFTLSNKLYNQLFSLDALNSPIILTTLHSGCIVSIPMMSSQNTGHSYNVLHEMYQSVIDVHGYHLEDQSHCCNSLLFIGEQGKIVMLLEGPDGTHIHKTWTVPGPISVSLLHTSTLYHSTYRDVYKTKLVSDTSIFDENTCKRPLHALKSESLRYGRIIGLGLGQDKDTSCIHIKGMTVDNRVLHIQTDVKHKPSILDSGQQLKDLLVRINNISEKLAEILSHIRQHEQIITCLHLASISISNSLQPCDPHSKYPTVPFCQEISVVSMNMGDKFTFSIVCCLRNTSHMTCENGWAYSVNVTTNTSSLLDNHCTKAIGLENFGPNQFQKVIIPCSESMLSSLPLSIEAVLIYSYKPSKLSQAVHVPIPLPTEQVTILDFIQPSSVATCGKHKNTINSFADAILDLSQAKPASVYHRDSTGRRSLEQLEYFSNVINLNSEDIQKITKGKVNCSDVLHAIIDQHANKPGETHIQKTIAPSNDQVILQCQLSVNSSIDLTIQSTSLKVLHQLKEAIHNKKVVKRNESNISSVKQTRTRLLQLQDLHCEVQTLQDIMCDKKDNSDREELIYKLYDHLRNIVSQ